MSSDSNNQNLSNQNNSNGIGFEVLRGQFASCYDETSWFASLATSIEGLTPEEAHEKPNEDVHSIAEIVQHLVFWNARYLKRFRGEAIEHLAIENDETFFPMHSGVARNLMPGLQQDWSRLAEQLHTVMQGWKEALTAANEETLRSLSPPHNKDAWYTTIAQINTHNAYHTGQIVFLRKLQGSWSEALSVK